MKLKTCLVWIFAVVPVFLFAFGCSRKAEPTVAKGVIFSVSYKDEELGSRDRFP